MASSPGYVSQTSSGLVGAFKDGYNYVDRNLAAMALVEIAYAGYSIVTGQGIPDLKTVGKIAGVNALGFFSNNTFLKPIRDKLTFNEESTSFGGITYPVQRAWNSTVNMVAPLVAFSAVTLATGGTFEAVKASLGMFAIVSVAADVLGDIVSHKSHSR